MGEVSTREGGAGTDAAVRALFDAQYARLVRLAALVTGDRGVAEDVVQDAFAQVLRRWSDIVEPGGYLRVAVVNGCVSWGRSQSRARRLAIAPGDGLSEDASADAIAVRDALAALPVDQRACVVLRYYGGFTEQEVASLLGCSVGTVKSRAHRALARLREELS